MINLDSFGDGAPAAPGPTAPGSREENRKPSPGHKRPGLISSTGPPTAVTAVLYFWKRVKNDPLSPVGALGRPPGGALGQGAPQLLEAGLGA